MVWWQIRQSEIARGGPSQYVHDGYWGFASELSKVSATISFAEDRGCSQVPEGHHFTLFGFATVVLLNAYQKKINKRLIVLALGISKPQAQIYMDRD